MTAEKKIIKIGMLGFTTGNTNLGCVALTYSMIAMLEKIRKKNNLKFEYRIFEAYYDKDKVTLLCENCNIPEDSVVITPLTARGIIKKIYAHGNIYAELLKCDCVIDITAGDSFADIYGKHIFNYYTKFKSFVERMHIPLILAPQTYGPFNNERIFKKAAKITDHAILAISRDQESKEYMEGLCKRKLYATTDIAFRLPFNKIDSKTSELKIGINISDLLFGDGTERAFDRSLLKTDYGCYIETLISSLQTRENYEIHLISHVGGDYGVSLKVAEKFPSCIVVPVFSNPVEAKSYISGMDVFIGSRMHATIASFSSGVATIPVAYSRKFSGLFGSLNYPYVIDLCNFDTDKSVTNTLEWIDKRVELCTLAEDSVKEAQKRCTKTEKLIERVLLKLK